ncbi:hypothetical protein [Methanoplanus endosymbiosus]|nr:hypothetical protein [Methanoplanus endosymbiosus]
MVPEMSGIIVYDRSGFIEEKYTSLYDDLSTNRIESGYNYI